jgi:hypothetical protein
MERQQFVIAQWQCQQKRIRFRWIAAFTFITLIFVVVLTCNVGELPQNGVRALALTSSLPQSKKAPVSARRRLQETCNGLANLCDLPANGIMYATLHNANAALWNGRWLLPNHKRSLEAAIEAGYRGINVDIGKCNGELRLVHGSCLLDTRDPVTVFRNINAFLSNNPNEVIIMPCEINNEAGEAVTLADISLAMMEAGFQDRLYAHPPGPDNPWPTLRELIDTDKRVLFFHYNGERCSDPSVTCPAGFHDWFQYAAETEYSFLTARQIRDTDRSCVITRGQNGERDFFGLNVFTKKPSVWGSLQVNSKRFLSQHIEDCAKFNDGLKPNLVLVDYWGLGGVLDAVREYNARL